MFCLHVDTMCVPGASHQVEIRKWHQVPRSWSYDGCEALCGFWESNSGPSARVAVISNAELALQPFLVCLFNGTHIWVKGDRKKITKQSCCCSEENNKGTKTRL